MITYQFFHFCLVRRSLLDRKPRRHGAGKSEKENEKKREKEKGRDGFS
jgi:hypothetical protein